MTVSPWADRVVLESPDGSRSARIDEAHEIAMGAPTSGRLVLSTGLALDACNPSMAWSDDSCCLAVPRWTADRRQVLLIVDARSGEVRTAPGTFRVLQLTRFRDGVVEGIDSPIHLPRPVRVDTRALP